MAQKLGAFKAQLDKLGLEARFHIRKHLIMQYAVQRWANIVLISLLISVAFGMSAALSQSGSAGGSIGNDEKTLSGSRSTPRAAETEKPAPRNKPRAEREEPRR